VFEDLGLGDAQERSLRTKLALRLNELINDEGLTQAKAAKHLHISQPHISELKNYKLNRFSSERLLHYITLFDRDVEILIRPRRAPNSNIDSSYRTSMGAVSVWATV
jgi:predicted XRE-type DNA-binding protein